MSSPMFSPLEDFLRHQKAARVNAHVGARFDAFNGRLQATPLQIEDAQRKVAGIVRCLNERYWGSDSTGEHGVVAGSWGKGTQGRPPRDVDLLFVLPLEVHQRFEQRVGNKQSALLQEVKDVLRDVYPKTDLRQDGQVVIVGFDSGHGVEVAPAFFDGRYWICDTNGGGRYKLTDPAAEIKTVADSHLASLSTTRELIRMIKRWQKHCNVDTLPSFAIELLVVDFIPTITYRLGHRAFDDWLIRDFFRFVITRANTYVFLPGTQQPFFLGEGWLTRAQTAAQRAERASRFEELEQHDAATAEWRDIFGYDIS